MIWDSVIWKLELRKELLKFERLISKHNIQSKYLGFRIEQFYFVSAYIIRKLLEAKKLSIECCSRDIHLETCSYIGGDRFLDKLNAHRIEEFYALNNAQHTTKDLRWICNKLIHSFCFFPLFNRRNKFCGIYFNTDENKRKELNYLEHRIFKKVLAACIKDDIVFSSTNRAANKTVSFSKMANAKKWLKSKEKKLEEPSVKEIEIFNSQPI